MEAHRLPPVEPKDDLELTSGEDGERVPSRKGEQHVQRLRGRRELGAPGQGQEVQGEGRVHTAEARGEGRESLWAGPERGHWRLTELGGLGSYRGG